MAQKPVHQGCAGAWWGRGTAVMASISCLFLKKNRLIIHLVTKAPPMSTVALSALVWTVFTVSSFLSHHPCRFHVFCWPSPYNQCVCLTALGLCKSSLWFLVQFSTDKRLIHKNPQFVLQYISWRPLVKPCNWESFRMKKVIPKRLLPWNSGGVT